MSPDRVPYLALISWLTLAALGTVGLAHYSVLPGRSGAPRGGWPEETQLRRGVRGTLLLFAHPDCPCTAATLREWDRLEWCIADGVEASVVAFTPQGEALDVDWLSPSPAGERRYAVVYDSGGREAQRFGIETSGHALLYGPDGDLLFSGGITAGRGHEGANRGGRALRSLLQGVVTTVDRSPVFGCAIRLPDPPEARPAP